MSGFAFVGLAAAADTDAVAPDGVSSLTIAKLTGAPSTASLIRGGTYSPDHARILFQMGEAPADTRAASSDFDFYVMRADGSQLTRLTHVRQIPAEYHVLLDSPQWWPNGTTIAWKYVELTQRDSGQLQTATVSTEDDLDTWTPRRLGSAVGRWAYTADRRYLAWTEQTTSVPFSSDFIVDLANGDQYRVRQSKPTGGGTATAAWSWAEQCDAAVLPALGPAGGGFDDVLAAISGPSQVCRFGAQPDEAPGATTPAQAELAIDTAPALPVEPATSGGVPTSGASNLVPISERIPARVGPTLTVRATSSRLSLARKRGFNVKYDVSGATSVRTWVLLSSALSEYGLDVQAKAGDTVTIARASTKVLKDGRITQNLTFDGQAEAALLKFYRVTVTLRLVATDAAGHKTTVEQPVTLSRLARLSRATRTCAQLPSSSTGRARHSLRDPCSGPSVCLRPSGRAGHRVQPRSRRQGQLRRRLRARWSRSPLGGSPGRQGCRPGTA
jgi:hypothetical protein